MTARGAGVYTLQHSPSTAPSELALGESSGYAVAAYSKATHCSRYLAKNLVHTEALRVGSKPTGDAICYGRGGALLSIHSTLQIARLRARYI